MVCVLDVRRCFAEVLRRAVCVRHVVCNISFSFFRLCLFLQPPTFGCSYSRVQCLLVVVLISLLFRLTTLKVGYIVQSCVRCARYLFVRQRLVLLLLIVFDVQRQLLIL
jgi:hypothetical protein